VSVFIFSFVDFSPDVNDVVFISANVEALAMWRHSLNVQPETDAE
jgi:hypothetical protein